MESVNLSGPLGHDLFPASVPASGGWVAHLKPDVRTALVYSPAVGENLHQMQAETSPWAVIDHLS